MQIVDRVEGEVEHDDVIHVGHVQSSRRDIRAHLFFSNGGIMNTDAQIDIIHEYAQISYIQICKKVPM